MILLLATLSFAANHVHTYVIDPAYTPAPFAGLERLEVDPVATAAALRPLAQKPIADVVADKPGHGQLVFTNTMSSWAVVAINDQRIGTIGPYATMTLDGITAGWYSVKTAMPTGFSRTFAVEVATK